MARQRTVVAVFNWFIRTLILHVRHGLLSAVVTPADARDKLKGEPLFFPYEHVRRLWMEDEIDNGVPVDTTTHSTNDHLVTF